MYNCYAFVQNISIFLTRSPSIKTNLIYLQGDIEIEKSDLIDDLKVKNIILIYISDT